jgi:hypothetical protein
VEQSSVPVADHAGGQLVLYPAARDFQILKQDTFGLFFRVGGNVERTDIGNRTGYCISAQRFGYFLFSLLTGIIIVYQIQQGRFTTAIDADKDIHIIVQVCYDE